MPNYTSAILVAVLTLTGGALAHATLGGNLESIETDNAQMKAKGARVSANAAYTVYEATLPGGTLIRQYVSIGGTVFAVAWSGAFKPDMRQLLGAHFDTMVARQAQIAHAGQARSLIKESDLVIESGGRMRDYFGRAYLPLEVPVGVSSQEIQ